MASRPNVVSIASNDVSWTAHYRHCPNYILNTNLVEGLNLQIFLLYQALVHKDINTDHITL
jgi:hypothetical protein